MKLGLLTRGAGLALLACLWIAGCQPAPTFQGNEVQPETEAPPLAGTNWNGESFDLAELRGRVAVVFFGYTFCPDVCPFTLAKMKQVSAGLGDQASDLAVVFVSVDPHRDTVDKLSRYVPNFQQDFYGLHLTPHELDTVSEDWSLAVQYGQPKDGPGTDSFYYVDHTPTYFVVDQEGRLRLELPPDSTAEDILSDLRILLDA